MVRLASIFNAIIELSMAAKISNNLKIARIPYTAVSGFILNSLYHIIGEHSGIDGDGLPVEDTVEAI